MKLGLGLGRILYFPPLGLGFSSVFSFSNIPGTVKSAPPIGTISVFSKSLVTSFSFSVPLGPSFNGATHLGCWPVSALFHFRWRHFHSLVRCCLVRLHPCCSVYLRWCNSPLRRSRRRSVDVWPCPATYLCSFQIARSRSPLRVK